MTIVRTAQSVLAQLHDDYPPLEALMRPAAPATPQRSTHADRSHSVKRFWFHFWFYLGLGFVTSSTFIGTWLGMTLPSYSQAANQRLDRVVPIQPQGTASPSPLGNSSENPSESLPGNPFNTPANPFSSPTSPANPQANPQARPQANPRSQPTIDASQLPENYTLGAGDRLKIEVFNIPEFTGEFNISVDGTLNAPWLGSVPVHGMTVNAVRELLTEKYSQYLTRPPVITITLLSVRPIKVAVSGEVNRPGTYLADLDQSNFTIDQSFQLPSLTQAIQRAGGITQRADIRKIQVVRPQLQGEPQVINIDLWKLIETGDIAQDIRLRDGDTVLVPTAATMNAAEAVQLSRANFAPEKMTVQVVGEVVRPGAVEVPANVTLNQAILSAGGFNNARARTSTVNLIRINPDGTVEQRDIRVDFAAPPNEENNPILQRNDVVIARRSTPAGVGDALNILLAPFNGVLSILNILGL